MNNKTGKVNVSQRECNVTFKLLRDGLFQMAAADMVSLAVCATPVYP